LAKRYCCLFRVQISFVSVHLCSWRGASSGARFRFVPPRFELALSFALDPDACSYEHNWTSRDMYVHMCCCAIEGTSYTTAAQFKGLSRRMVMSTSCVLRARFQPAFKCHCKSCQSAVIVLGAHSMESLEIEYKLVHEATALCTRNFRSHVAIAVSLSHMHSTGH